MGGTNSYENTLGSPNKIFRSLGVVSNIKLDHRINFLREPISELSLSKKKVVI